MPTPNKYAGKCACCGIEVPERAGYVIFADKAREYGLTPPPSKKWVVVHSSCWNDLKKGVKTPEHGAPNHVSDSSNQEAQQQAQQQAQQERESHYAAVYLYGVF